MKRAIFAGNWKMHLGPSDARKYLEAFLRGYRPETGRDVWFFPPAVSLEAVARQLAGQAGVRVGVQNIHWEAKGAFTGEVSAPMARDAGATLALVGHSERRHVFGETDDQTQRKVKAALESELTPVLCVGETLDQRNEGATTAVVERQLGAIAGLGAAALNQIVIAYEPVWAIGTGRNATPADAAAIHHHIRQWLAAKGATPASIKVLYGGSVKPDNVASLVSEPQIDGVLVGGASVDPAAWSTIVATRIN